MTVDSFNSDLPYLEYRPHTHMHVCDITLVWGAEIADKTDGGARYADRNPHILHPTTQTSAYFAPHVHNEGGAKYADRSEGVQNMLTEIRIFCTGAGVQNMLWQGHPNW